MHDGSLTTLDVVLDHYARGGHSSASKSSRITGFTLDTASEATSWRSSTA